MEEFVNLAKLLLEIYAEGENVPDVKMPKHIILETAADLCEAYENGKFGRDEESRLYYSGMLDDFGGRYEKFYNEINHRDDIRFKFYLDEKVTNWMRTKFEVTAPNFDAATAEAIRMLEAGELEELPWEDLLLTERMDPIENGGQETQELYGESNTQLYSNGKKQLG